MASSISVCGCLYSQAGTWQYLPQVSLDVHTTILSSTSRTKLTQTFLNPSRSDPINQVSYTFPLYDGVSVVGFRCHIGDRILNGIVKEKEQAKADFNEAVRLGQQAGLLEQSVDASDVFRTTLGNVPADGKVTVEITYVGELKQDAQTNGVRYVLPTVVAPRYGSQSWPSTFTSGYQQGGIKITLDVSVEKGSVIRGLQSPSHPYQMSLGRTSTMPEDSFEPHLASATTSIPARGTIQLEQDFVMLVNAEGQDMPVAFIETHPTLPRQRALVASLVPKFSLPNITPEIVFIIDRSGSMRGRIETLKSALRVFLKSLPIGVMFNICSFGSHFSFLWQRSKSYNASSLKEALLHVDTIDANMGGTEMQLPVEATVTSRLKDMELEILLITDGEIWDQKRLFSFINKAASENPIRLFSLGIGHAASHALIEGVARAGNGFAQSVLQDEELDKKVVRMLKGALTPHINDYTIEVEYGQEDEDDFEVIEQANAIPSVEIPFRGKKTVEVKSEGKEKQPISLFDSGYKEPELESTAASSAAGDRFKGLPPVQPPRLLQVPTKIPQLYPLFRSTVYILFSPESHERSPQTLVVRATSKHGPLQLRIPIQDVGNGETIHQLAARRALVELEERRGWLSDAKVDDGGLVKDMYDSKWEDIVAREGVRLGTRFQIAGEWTSFVAVEKDNKGNIIHEGTITQEKQEEQEYLTASPGASFCSFTSNSTQMAPAQSASLFGAPPVQMRMRQSLVTPTSSPPYRTPSARGGFRGCSTRGMSPTLHSASATSSVSLFGAPAPPPPNAGFGGNAPSLFAASSLSGPPPSSSAAFGQSSPSDAGSLYGAGSLSRPPPSSNDFGEVSKSESDIATKLHALIALQTFRGSWEWNQDLLRTLDLIPDVVEKQVKEAFDIAAKKNGTTQPINPFGSRDSTAILATMLALIFLDKKAADSKDVWELIADKAQGWITSTLANMDEAFRTLFNDAKPAFNNLF
jgi:hypothetical protein